jgi:hypothetical protein
MKALLLKAGLPEWQVDMAVATPDGIVRDVVRDSMRSSAHAQLPEGKPRGQPSQIGWQDGTPLGPPAGVDLIDAQVRAADVRERAEQVAKLAGDLAALRTASDLA